MKTKTDQVPQTATQTEFNFKTVRVVPELQIKVATWPPARRRAYATLLESYAHQLRITASILERQAAPRPKKLKFIRADQMKLN